MIEKQSLSQFIEKQLEGTPLFLVDVKVSAGNDIEVEIDSEEPVSIDACERLTRAIEAEFDRDKEDYNLEVGSAGLTSPFKVKKQYAKHVGHEVEVVTSEGKKFVGVLRHADEDSFTIESQEKVKKEGMKRPVIEVIERSFPYNEIKKTNSLLKF